MKKKLYSTAAAALATASFAQTAKTIEELLAEAKKVAFKRGLDEAQQDEQVRLETIRPEQITPYYALVEIARSLVSAQFLNADEDVSVENRETLLKVRYDEHFTDVVIAGQDGKYLGTLFLLDDDEVHITDLGIDGYNVIMVTVPTYDVVEVYVFDVNYDQYVFALSEPLPVVAKAA